MPITAGHQAPDFALRDQHGQTVTLSAYRGRRPVVLVFYPWAFSRVCQGELTALRDALARFEEAGAGLLAVSCDPMFALRAFAEASGLTFPLLSDHWPHGAVASAFGVFDEAIGAATRSTFVIDRAGTVVWAVHNAIPYPRDLDEYLEVLRTL
jgi:peroxiredoxin